MSFLPDLCRSLVLETVINSTMTDVSGVGKSILFLLPGFNRKQNENGTYYSLLYVEMTLLHFRIETNITIYIYTHIESEGGSVF